MSKCKHCGNEIKVNIKVREGVELECDRCWELRTRIKYAHKLAKRFLDNLRGEK